MIPILFENEEIIIIDKPVGLPSQPGEGVHDDVIGVLERQCGRRFLPVHRLDKETSGCMALAKDASAARSWSELISGKVVRKRYFAWVFGKPDKSSGIIDVELEGDRGMQRAKTLWSLREVWTLPISDVVETATPELSSQPPAPALAAPRALARVSGPIALSLLELELKTGRMHQIRRHLAGIGHPILADDRHGDFALNKILRRAGVKRLMLWARELVLPLIPGLPSLPDLPGGGSILSAEPPHFVALHELLARYGTLEWQPQNAVSAVCSARTTRATNAPSDIPAPEKVEDHEKTI